MSSHVGQYREINVLGSQVKLTSSHAEQYKCHSIQGSANVTAYMAVQISSYTGQYSEINVIAYMAVM